MKKIDAKAINLQHGTRLRPRKIREKAAARPRVKKRPGKSTDRKNQFKTIFDNSLVGIYRTTPDGRILLGNPGLLKMLGFDSLEELAGRNLDEEGFEPDYSRAVFKELMETEGEIRGLEARWTKRDGSVLFVRESAHAVRDRDGSILYYDGVVEDITELKQTEEKLNQNLEKLKRTLEKTVTALSSAVGKRDPYTSGHQQRVTQLACAIAQEMDLSGEQVDGIRIASMLHDIGKICVPAEILSKPTALTEAEFGIIKAHCQTGYEILKDIEFPWPVAIIVLQHHERLDGSGYPGGIKGDAILQSASILAVADVLEAMSSHRPYRPARGLEPALEEIAAKQGILYDSRAATSCLLLFRDKGFRFNKI